MTHHPTDVSAFKDTYRKATKNPFPTTISLTISDQTRDYVLIPQPLRYGTNPHQPFAAYIPQNSRHPLAVGNMTLLKGGKDGLSLTNLQDFDRALAILKYFSQPACVIMKHLNPCGFKVKTEHVQDCSLEEIYTLARDCDARSAFGSVIGFNVPVDAETADAIMGSFVECVLAPDYTEEAVTIFKKNEGTKKLNNAIRIAQVENIHTLPKFNDEDTTGYERLVTLGDGTLTIETPYTTRIKSLDDLIVRPMIPNTDPTKNNGQNYVADKLPTERELQDALTAWYITAATRSNAVVFVKDGAAFAIGTGEQERVGAVEKAIEKAVKKGHRNLLNGAVMGSDAFFPNRDSIDRIAQYGVSAIIWPAGSMNDAQIIEAANEHGIALMATLERCFYH